MFNYFIKKPIFSIGILFFIIFLFQLNKSGYFEKRRKLFSAASCTALTVKLKRLAPKDWELECNGHFAEKTDTLEVKIRLPEPNQNKISARAYVYREMANHFMFISKNSPIDNLEKLSWVKLSLIYKENQADGIVKGLSLSKMRTLKSQESILGHFQGSVSVKDNF